MRGIIIDHNTHKNIDIITIKGGKSGGGTWYSIESQNNNHNMKYK